MPQTDDTLSITLKLGSQILPMTVARKDEFIYREAEKLINQRFAYYTAHYPRLGNELYLTMMALDIAVQLKGMERDTDPKPMLEALQGMLGELEGALAEGTKKP